MNLISLSTGVEWWDNFCQKVSDFFLIPDGSGINYLTRIGIAIGLIIVGWIVIRFVGFLLKKAFKISKKGPNIDKSAKFFIITLIKILLWLVVALFVIAILKFDLAGFAGVASAVTVALGLALQDLIGCLFSGILLLQQKSTKTGDYISVKNDYGLSEGFVKDVHLFFTHLRTPQGQVVTIPNNTMTKAAVTNYSTLGKRRIDYDVGVSYDSDIALTKEVLKNIMDADERILKDEDKSVYVVNLDKYSVQVRFRCWTKFEDYWPVYNELSEKILLEFRKNNIYIPSSTDISIKK